MEESSITTPVISENDIEISWFSGTGPGGQNRNKVQACCRVRHVPTGITSVSQMRTRNMSLSQAMDDLRKKIEESIRTRVTDNERRERMGQIGTGQRGDKIRTVQFQNDAAVDHRTGRRISAAQYMKGNMDRLW